MLKAVERSIWGPPACVSETKRSLFRTAMVVGLTVMAVLLGPLFADMVSLVGAFSMSFQCFILPAIFHLKLFEGRLSMKERLRTQFVLIVGVVAMLVASTVSVVEIVAYFTSGTDKPCDN